MNKEVLDYVVEKTHELIDAPTCSSEAREAAKAWLDALGTDAEAAETKKYIDELEADIMPIDTLISLQNPKVEVSALARMLPRILRHMPKRSSCRSQILRLPGLRSRSRDSGKERKSSLKQTEPTSTRHSFYSLKQQDMRLSIE